MLYERNDIAFGRGRFRVRGDVVEVHPANLDDEALRIEFFGDEVDSLKTFDPLTGHAHDALTTFTLYTLTASHANDRAKTHETVSVSTGLLFLYCAGAIVAPTLAASLMRIFGPGALYAQNAAAHIVLAAFALSAFVGYWPTTTARDEPAAPGPHLPRLERPAEAGPGAS